MNESFFLHIHVFITVIPDNFLSFFIPFSFFNIKHHPWGKNKRKTDINFSSRTPRRYLNHINLPRLLFIYAAWKGRKFFSKFTLVAVAETVPHKSCSTVIPFRITVCNFLFNYMGFPPFTKPLLSAFLFREFCFIYLLFLVSFTVVRLKWTLISFCLGEILDVYVVSSVMHVIRFGFFLLAPTCWFCDKN